MNPRDWRYMAYTFLIGAALVTSSARIAAVTSNDHRTPFLSANDRSRWSTVAALVDDGCFEIDRFQTQRGWQTIDKVWHVGRDGDHHFYSSKPPLLATVVAGEYWLFQRITGLRLETHPFIVGRALLWITNIPALALYLLAIASLVERWGSSDWGRVLVVAAASWCTFITTFAVTLNNHLPAAVCVAAVLYCISWMTEPSRRAMCAAGAGLAAALTVTFELPALSFFVLVLCWYVWSYPREGWLYFVPSAAVVAIAFLTCNYVAHGGWQVPYAHREWYDYPGSYWRTARTGPDRGESSRAWYAFHVLFGHHGIFSLTPIWCLSGFGIILTLRARSRDLAWMMAAATALLTCTCLAFYVSRPEIDRNYGGVTCGLRWMFWLVPLGLITLLPIADDWSSHRGRRWAILMLCGVSMFSAAYGWANPWINPWPYQFAISQGWIAR